MTAPKSDSRFGFSLRPNARSKHYLGEFTSKLLRDGSVVADSIPGVDLEAAVSVNNGWLLFITHNIPHEEQLDLHLLSQTGEPLERLTLRSAYTAGLFGSLRQVADGVFEFRFFQSRLYRVTVRDSPTWHLPFVGAPPGVAWRGQLRTRLSITDAVKGSNR